MTATRYMRSYPAFKEAGRLFVLIVHITGKSSGPADAALRMNFQVRWHPPVKKPAVFRGCAARNIFKNPAEIMLVVIPCHSADIFNV